MGLYIYFLNCCSIKVAFSPHLENITGFESQEILVYGMGLSLFAISKTHYSYPPGKQCNYAGQSVRALPIRILTVGKKRSPGVQLIADEYMEKLKNYCSVQDIRLKSNPKNAKDVMAQIEHEDISVMSLVKSNEWVVMLDEHGADVGSEQMATLIGDAGNTGASSIVFCIGGPYGHGRQLKERADVSIKLSSLVLNHEVALVVLIEQLYRAWTILKGQKYHH
ncbi:putative RNA methyltransferase At5g10620 isoform X2 [Primulina eburnea]|uniref:putative RNA methyltransferase At5g10620 isoform X2 n=1 Tax=Primulina eburnea TaxID=1245227 RepID=UPI003C6C5DA0